MPQQTTNNDKKHNRKRQDHNPRTITTTLIQHHVSLMGTICHQEYSEHTACQNNNNNNNNWLMEAGKGGAQASLTKDKGFQIKRNNKRAKYPIGSKPKTKQ